MANSLKPKAPIFRPIERPQWSEDRAAQALFAFNQSVKLSAGRNESSRRRFASASAGVQLAGSGLGGGTYDPVTPGRTTSTVGTT